MQVPNSLEFPQISFCNHRYFDLANAIQLDFGQVDIPDKQTMFSGYLDAIKKLIDLIGEIHDDPSGVEFPHDVYQWKANFTREIMSVPMIATFLTSNNSPEDPSYEDISTIHEPFIMTCLHETHECKLNHLIKYRDPNFLICYRYDPNKDYGTGDDDTINISQGVANGISMVLFTGVGLLNAQDLMGDMPALSSYAQTAHAASPTSGADGIRVMIHHAGMDTNTLFPKRNITLFCPFLWCPWVSDPDPRSCKLLYLLENKLPSKNKLPWKISAYGPCNHSDLENKRPLKYLAT